VKTYDTFTYVFLRGMKTLESVQGQLNMFRKMEYRDLFEQVLP
jgi:hypothetical protein